MFAISLGWTVKEPLACWLTDASQPLSWLAAPEEAHAGAEAYWRCWRCRGLLTLEAELQSTTITDLGA